MRILIVLVACLAIYLALRLLYRQNPAKFSRGFIYASIATLILGTVFLAATGRLHWMFALFAGLLPLASRLVGLLRFLPLFKMFQAYRNKQQGGAGWTGSGNRAGVGTSSVQSHYFRMTLDHGSGEMRGSVLAGKYSGSELSQLGVEQLREVLLESAADGDSKALFIAYLERRFGPDWQHQFSVSGEDGSGRQEQSGDMSRNEAVEILGLSESASKEQIIKAHRSLMQKFHPDRGGSDYLAAKINRAKEILLGGD
jgi:hypothetical protein